ncbi:hypothetical protein ACHAQA_003048 [Verticillium albo-atrum]
MNTITTTTVTASKPGQRTLSTTREDDPKWIGPLLALIALATASYLLFEELFELLNLAAAIVPFCAHFSGTIAALLVFRAVSRALAAVPVRSVASGLFPSLCRAASGLAPSDPVFFVSSGTQAGESCVRDAGFPTCGRPAFCCRRTDEDLSTQFRVTLELEARILRLEHDNKLYLESARAAQDHARVQEGRLASALLAHQKEIESLRAEALAQVEMALASASVAIVAVPAPAEEITTTAAAITTIAAVAETTAEEGEREGLAVEVASLREELATFRPDPFARATIVSLRREKAQLAERVAELELAVASRLVPAALAPAPAPAPVTPIRPLALALAETPRLSLTPPTPPPVLPSAVRCAGAASSASPSHLTPAECLWPSGRLRSLVKRRHRAALFKMGA